MLLSNYESNNLCVLTCILRVRSFVRKTAGRLEKPLGLLKPEKNLARWRTLRCDLEGREALHRARLQIWAQATTHENHASQNPQPP